MKPFVDEHTIERAVGHAVEHVNEPLSFRDPLYVVAVALLLGIGLLFGWFLGQGLFSDQLGADLLGRLYCAALGLLGVSLFVRIPARRLRGLLAEFAVCLTVPRLLLSVTLSLIVALVAGLFVRLVFRDASVFSAYASVLLTAGIAALGLWIGVLRNPLLNQAIKRAP